MRHKYVTKAIVVGRTPLGETNALMTLLTEEVGLVRARAQGVRRPGAKLAHSLVTLVESEVFLVKGIEGWRVTGATLSKNWSRALSRAARARAARITGLVIRMTPPESADGAVFTLFQDTLRLLSTDSLAHHEAVECQAVLRLLSALGLDAGAIPTLDEVETSRSDVITRINRGIAHSGL